MSGFYDLPRTVELAGRPVPVRYDFRPALDILAALADPALTDPERAAVALGIFYPALPPDADPREALEACFAFLAMGAAPVGGGERRLVDWERDFPLIVGPVNRVLGYEVRAVPYDPAANTGGVHWHTFLGAYYEIGGDCTFAQVVAIRDKLARREKLDRAERAWYRRHRALVDLPAAYTAPEEEILRRWTAPAGDGGP